MAMVKTRRKRDGKMERAGKRNGKKEKKRKIKHHSNPSKMSY